MQPNPPVSFGSGSSLLGAPASTVLNQPTAMAQQSPASPGFVPGLLPPPPASMPQQQNPMGGQPPMPQQSAPQPMSPLGGQPPAPQGTVGLPPSNPEAQLILTALSNRLKSLSKVEESQKIPPEPMVSNGTL